jgi:DNA-directed RNA polymerase subunit K
MELTRFEAARIIAARALQIAQGAPIMVKTDLKDPKEIAKLEYEKGVLPLTVLREEYGKTSKQSTEEKS